jgi:hypothetical protein
MKQIWSEKNSTGLSNKEAFSLFHLSFQHIRSVQSLEDNLDEIDEFCETYMSLPALEPAKRRETALINTLRSIERFNQSVRITVPAVPSNTFQRQKMMRENMLFKHPGGGWLVQQEFDFSGASEHDDVLTTIKKSVKTHAKTNNDISGTRALAKAFETGNWTHILNRFPSIRKSVIMSEQERAFKIGKKIISESHLQLDFESDNDYTALRDTADETVELENNYLCEIDNAADAEAMYREHTSVFATRDIDRNEAVYLIKTACKNLNLAPVELLQDKRFYTFLGWFVSGCTAEQYLIATKRAEEFATQQRRDKKNNYARMRRVA